MLKHIASPSERRKAGANGFTLVELLVVIVILGILAGVVVFAVTGLSGRSRENTCKNEGRTIKTAIEAYNADTGEYPDSYADLNGGTDPDVKYLDDDKAPKYWSIGSGGSMSRILTSGGGDAVGTAADECPDIY